MGIGGVQVDYRREVGPAECRSAAHQRMWSRRAVRRCPCARRGSAGCASTPSAMSSLARWAIAPVSGA